MLRDGSTLPSSLPGPAPVAPITVQQWLGFYGLNDVPAIAPGGGLIPATGQGQTVVIISIYRDPSYRDSSDPNWMQSGLAVYSQEMGLNTNFGFTMVNEDGDPSFADLPARGIRQTTASSTSTRSRSTRSHRTRTLSISLPIAVRLRTGSRVSRPRCCSTRQSSR